LSFGPSTLLQPPAHITGYAPAAASRRRTKIQRNLVDLFSSGALKTGLYASSIGCFGSIIRNQQEKPTIESWPLSFAAIGVKMAFQDQTFDRFVIQFLRACFKIA
jgi:hypothetical protein